MARFKPHPNPPAARPASQGRELVLPKLCISLEKVGSQFLHLVKGEARRGLIF